jgi:hypothetical protein
MKPLIPPTYQHLLISKIPVILLLYHNQGREQGQSLSDSALQIVKVQGAGSANGFAL